MGGGGGGGVFAKYVINSLTSGCAGGRSEACVECRVQSHAKTSRVFDSF